MSAYDPIARLYDPWSSSVIEDISFYVEEALSADSGPVVELGVGTGRLAVPIAAEGIRVIGVDSSAGMLEVASNTCTTRAGAKSATQPSTSGWRFATRRGRPDTGCTGRSRAWVTNAWWWRRRSLRGSRAIG